MDRALSREKAFFERHGAYRPYSQKCGIPYLTRVLGHLLMSNIRAWLPRVRTDVSLLIQHLEQEQRKLGDPIEAEDPHAAGKQVLKLLSRYASNYCAMLDGQVHADAADGLLTQVLFGGARIQEHIRSRFFHAVENWMRTFTKEAHKTLPSEQILMALRNSSGPRPALFIPEAAFEALARRHVSELKELGQQFVRQIYDELRTVAEACKPRELLRFGDLQQRAVEVVQQMLWRAYEPCREQVVRMTEVELAFINTLHPDFVGADGAAAAVRGFEDLRQIGRAHV